jgi:hypothetical protein
VGVAVGSGGVPIADSGGGVAGDGLSAGSLVMGPSLPLPASNETTMGTHGALKRGVTACISIVSGKCLAAERA